MAMRVLVLGGYGLIGGEILNALASVGFETAGMGRDAELGRRLHPASVWFSADIAKLDTAASWSPFLQGVDAVVNAAGALQDGPRDHLHALQKAFEACIAAAERAGVRRFVQISAPGASADATTEFYRTKAAADAALRASRLDWVIFKPGLVISRNAYGGTALVRMLAGVPFVSPLAHADARLQTVAAEDVASAVVKALQGAAPLRADYDLVEGAPHTLRHIVNSFRRWLGVKPAVLELSLPDWTAKGVAFIADVAGALGWRSPLRSTALKAISEGVLGDPSAWRAATGSTMKTLEETLAANPSTLQERIFARAQLALPIAVATLALFWIASGVIGLVSLDAAAQHLVSAVGEARAKPLAFAGAVLDIAIGTGLLVRATARRAALASIAVAAFYLAAGTLLVPALWLDPFGALLKVIPAMVLAFSVALLLEER
ncbi:MAG: SDR family oxidoreductase [Pseudomonadota bacterium]|nr:SDR family oxidoreductase [Pseudomonadota bacterium]